MSVSFGKKVLPTKIELIRLKKSLKVSRTIHKILEDKRDVLLRRLDEMIDEATKARDETGKPLSDAYLALYDAYLEMGPINLESTASTTPISKKEIISSNACVISSLDTGMSICCLKVCPSRCQAT